ncbi:hypothetical protein BDZ94DRAFT_1239681 [Collybia nuda]|uniref:Uncharacterized protein n=1 Tax=Collybia nuda TaxID=64659 RepID=A0A9P5XY22_9AGAR|nr:hypothetical protein BDZ94DRAFT_1239681 [Collybia nuda]
MSFIHPTNLVSRKNILLVVAIVFLSFCQLGGGFVAILTDVDRIMNDSISNVNSHFSHISGIIELGSSILCNIMISASLVVYLRRNRNRSNTFPSMVALTNLISWLAVPEPDFTSTIFHSILGKVYAQYKAENSLGFECWW